MTGEPTDAETLVQDVFARAYVKVHEVRPGTNFRAWLYRILTATFVEAHRKHGGDPDRAGAVQGIDDRRLEQVRAPTQLAGVATGAQAHLRVDDVRAALQSIPYDVRIVVYLADVEDFSREDIGHILGMPTVVVKSRLRSGHRQLCIPLRVDYRVPVIGCRPEAIDQCGVRVEAHACLPATGEIEGPELGLAQQGGGLGHDT